MEQTVKVRFHEDGEHLWIGSKQFVSLNRFLEVKKDQNKETKLLQEEVERLTKENDALKVLLTSSLH